MSRMYFNKIKVSLKKVDTAPQQISAVISSVTIWTYIEIDMESHLTGKIHIS